MNTTLFHKVMRGVLLLSWLTYSGVAHAADVLTSPDGRLRVTVGVKGGKPFYAVCRDGKPVVNTSYLGFTLDDGDFCNDFKVMGRTRNSKTKRGRNHGVRTGWCATTITS